MRKNDFKRHSRKKVQKLLLTLAKRIVLWLQEIRAARFAVHYQNRRLIQNTTQHMAENSINWQPSSLLPSGWERKVLLWIVWPEMGWPSPPEPKIGWWKHGPQTFAFEEFENANHLVKFWAEINEPS